MCTALVVTIDASVSPETKLYTAYAALHICNAITDKDDAILENVSKIPVSMSMHELLLKIQGTRVSGVTVRPAIYSNIKQP